MQRLREVIEKLINDSPYIQEAMAEGLINNSSLARNLNPAINKILGKETSESSILMAIKRLPPGPNQRIEKKIKNFMSQLGDLVVRSNLTKFTFGNYIGISRDQAKFLSVIEDIRDNFYTVSRGVTETTIITNRQFSPQAMQIFDEHNLLHQRDNLSSITMKLPEINVEISGVYYYILKKLAWEGINLSEVISTTNEFTIVIDTALATKAFSVLMELKTQTIA